MQNAGQYFRESGPAIEFRELGEDLS